jgi:hypothetical protein
MATMQDFGGLLFGGGGTGLEDYLSADQQSGIRNQALLQAAAALLSAGGPSERPVSLGQALGGALQAGSEGYQKAQQGAIQNLLTGQKLQEAKRAMELQRLTAQTLLGGEAPLDGTKPEDIKFNQYMKLADIYAGAGKGQEAKLYQDMAYQIKPRAEVTGSPFEVTDTTGKPLLVQQMKDGTIRTVGGYGPKRDVVLQNLGGRTVAIDKSQLKGGETYTQTLAPQVVGGAEAGGYFQVGGGGGGGVGGAPRPAGAPSTVAPTGGAGAPQAAPTGPQPLIPIIPLQGKVFGNEKDLRGEFQAQVKPYVELGQAYQKIETAAKNPSPAGDIAMVYGFMKVLDPSSVVREGEFATAQNAGSVPDSVRNMYNKALNGERLNEKIRSDFLQQARNLVESQRVMSNDLISRYTEVAKNYKLDPNQVVYDPFKRVQTPEQIIGGATTTNIPQTRQEWWQRFNLRKPNE